ncbi:hypothetical protein BK146_24965 [Paenibacillus sp. FSL R7-0333]|nr:hypothetical protein BK146_24965 [Paenibacillus sp. FSL R7-0333]
MDDVADSVGVGDAPVSSELLFFELLHPERITVVMMMQKKSCFFNCFPPNSDTYIKIYFIRIGEYLLWYYVLPPREQRLFRQFFNGPRRLDHQHRLNNSTSAIIFQTDFLSSGMTVHPATFTQSAVHLHMIFICIG